MSYINLTKGELIMKILLAKIIALSSLLISVSFSAGIKDDTFSVLSNDAHSVTQKDSLIIYLNEVLLEAGFSDSVRKYLVENAQVQTRKISPIDQKEKMRLLKRNLYIYLKNMSEKHQTSASSSVINKQYFIAEQHSQSWDYILSSDVLSIFKSNHIFDQLTVEDVKNVDSKFCAVWPFCSAN